MPLTITINEKRLDVLQTTAAYVAVLNFLDSLEFHSEFPIDGEDGITSYDLRDSCGEVAVMLQ